MKIFKIIAALLLLSSVPAGAASTINPTVPAQAAPLSSAPVRNNFLAAYNDINNILGMYAGPSAPAAPTNLQSWADTSASPIYVFKYFNQQNGVWVAYGSLNINTNVYTPVFSTAGFIATPPLTVSVNSGVVTYGISLGSNFAVTGSALHLAAIPSGNLIANCGASSAEPTACSWTSFADRAISSSNNTIPSRVGGVWATVNTGTSGHAIPFLDTSNRWSAAQTTYLGASTLPTALVTTVDRISNADGTASTYEATAFGANGEFACVRANNTATSPAALTNGSVICSVSAYGYDGTSFSGTIASYFRMYAAGTWSNTSHPTYARIATVPSASTAAVDRLSVESDGGVTVPPTVTGGSKGAGTLNATGLYVSNDVVATLTAAQTLSSKTLASPIITGTLGGTGVVPNAALVNAATTVNGQTCTLGSTCTVTAVASSLTVGTTTVTGGVSGNMLYNNAGVLGERGVTGSGNSVLATAPTISNGIFAGASVFPNNGVRINDPVAGFNLILSAGSNLTADRTLTFTTGDANRNITLAGNLTTAGANPLTFTTTGTTNVTLPTTGTLVAQASTDTLTNKTINGSNNTITNVSLATGVTGNLPPSNLNGGTSASSATFWRGDGVWATPAGSGNVTGPGSSTNGNIVTFNGTTGTLIQDSGIAATSVARVISYQDISVNGTYTPPAGLLYAIVEVIGGGGAGGGSVASATTVSGGGGGGGGAYSRCILSAASIGASQTVTIGNGGVGSAGNGTAGGTTSFGTLCTAAGGGGGIAGTAGTIGTGGSGATTGTANFRMAGGDGLSSNYATVTTVSAQPGVGGVSGAGGGGARFPSVSFGAAANGIAATSYGGGGSGAGSQGTTGAGAGGGGGAGHIFVTEYRYN